MSTTYIFPQLSSLFVTSMSVISFTILAVYGFLELREKHLHYSKFWNSGSKTFAVKEIKLSSRTGMLIAYTPAFLAAVASFVIYPQEDIRMLLLSSALTIHFLKRILEVLFVHKYSGGMILDSAVIISLSYGVCTASVTYAQSLTKGLPEPSIDLKYLGCLLFILGISGNFYHHCLLSRMRRLKGDKEYKIPKGGLFGIIICPHYLFEIIGFVGVALISQTLYGFSFTIGSALYLIARSYMTRRWYVSKFEDFPKNVKALIPYVL
ncbi:very-long-chain enoyl-CoA reductase-like [Pyrus ussuriensis x Pyrus communis]|uniref:Very-long-chain enoyl-CoA reductase-like n=1 Tax=Pyrus ussuriensis x Pyrus communis TaxID=2448454 RepID=A0A5N5HM22_9ROSA|nr:very-long-chain enoyl-CoA reductase-like [Pyrus ussuriensis x Pyrus communis]